MSETGLPDLSFDTVWGVINSNDEPQQQQQSPPPLPPPSSSGQQRRHERRNTLSGASSRGSISTSIPHEFQVVDRILALFHDPDLMMRFSFETKSNPTVPFYRQGDQSTIPDADKQARQRLLQNRAVRRAIDRIWDLFKFKDVRYGASREQYTEFHQLVSRTLRSDSHDITQTQGVAARDWLHDCSSNHGILLDAWRGSLFELVDLWELGNDHGCYVAFLDTLLVRIAEPVSSLHIHKAIAKSWKPSAAASDARLLTWALANVELKFRALKDVPTPKLGPSPISIYSADQQFQDESNLNIIEMHTETTNLESDPVSAVAMNPLDEKVLARLEAFLVQDEISEIAAEDAVVEMVHILEESRARFASYMSKTEESLKMMSLESCCANMKLSDEADRVRHLYVCSNMYSEREKERPEYPDALRHAGDAMQWDILTRNGFVKTVLNNEMLPRMGQIWNKKPSVNSDDAGGDQISRRRR